MDGLLQVLSEPQDAAEGVFAFIATFFRSMGITQLHSAQGGTDPMKKEDDPAGFLQWMDATMRSTGIVAGDSTIATRTQHNCYSHTAEV